MTEATEPVDDDDLGAAVCVTAKGDVAEDFANGFMRFGTFEEVGVVLVLDAKKITSDFETLVHEAETASFDEAEYRIRDNITPLADYLVEIRIVGNRKLLERGLSDVNIGRLSEASDLIEKMWDDHRRETSFTTIDEFCKGLKALLRKSKK